MVTAWKVGCPASAPAALLHSALDTPALEGDIPGQAAKAKPLDSGPSFLFLAYFLGLFLKSD